MRGGQKKKNNGNESKPDKTKPDNVTDAER